MGEDDTSEDFFAALQHAAATRYAANRVLDLWEGHPDLSVSQLLAMLEGDAHEALVNPQDRPSTAFLTLDSLGPREADSSVSGV